MQKAGAKFFITGLLLIAVAIGFQNCGGGFEAGRQFMSLNSSTASPVLGLKASAMDLVQGEKTNISIELTKSHSSDLTVKILSNESDAKLDQDFRLSEKDLVIPAGAILHSIGLRSLLQNYNLAKKEIDLKIEATDGKTTESVDLKVGILPKYETLLFASMSSYRCGVLASGALWCENGQHKLFSDNLLLGAKAIYGTSRPCLIDRSNLLHCLSKSDDPSSLVSLTQIGPIKSLSKRSPQVACAIDANDELWCWRNPNSVSKNASLGKVLSVGTDYDACIITQAGSTKCGTVNFEGLIENTVDILGLQAPQVIAGGTREYCAIESSGAVKCWNIDENPVLVTAINGAANAQSLSLHSATSCALIADGGVKCWGIRYNESDPTAAIEIELPAAFHAVEIRSDYSNTCALGTSGEVLCWTTSGVSAGKAYKFLTNLYDYLDFPGADVKEANSGYFDRSCFLDNAGKVFCKGSSIYGGLGNGVSDGSNFDSFQSVQNVSNATALASGFFSTCAMIAGGSVKCWGSRGPEVGSFSSVPYEVEGTLNAKKLSSTFFGSCIVDDQAKVKCWGQRPDLPSAGDQLQVTAEAQLVDGLLNIVDVESYQRSASYCAINSSGEVLCWENTSYPLNVNSRVPTKIGNLAGVQSVSAGVENACALLATGVVKCWGRNTYGGLGDGTKVDSLTSAVPVSNVANAVALIKNGYGHCALLSTGGLKCWGGDISSSLFSGKEFLTAEAVAAPKDIRQLSLELSSGLMLLNDGSLREYGLPMDFGYLVRRK